MRKLILSLFFLALSNNFDYVICMDKNDLVLEEEQNKPDENLNLFESRLSTEVILYLLEFCLDSYSNNILIYFEDAKRAIKTIRSVNRQFNSFSKKLVGSAKNIAKRFSRDLNSFDKAKLDGKLIEVFNKAYNHTSKEAKCNKDELIAEAERLIIAGADCINITLDYHGPSGHPIKVPILQFIARTNLLVNLISILVIYRINLNAKDLLDNTALHSAVSLGHSEVVNMLCQCGADVNIPNKSGNISLINVIWSKAKLDNIQEIIQLLIKYEVNVNKANNEGNTVLHLAAEQLLKCEEKELPADKYVNIIHLLLGLADMSIINKHGETVLNILVDYDGDDEKLRQLSLVAQLENTNSNNKDALISDFTNKYLHRLKSDKSIT